MRAYSIQEESVVADQYLINNIVNYLMPILIFIFDKYNIYIKYHTTDLIGINYYYQYDYHHDYYFLDNMITKHDKIVYLLIISTSTEM